MKQADINRLHRAADHIGAALTHLENKGIKILKRWKTKFITLTELKKIENEIEILFGAKDSELQEVTYYIPKGFHAEIDDDKVVIKKGEKTAKWSEEDEKIALSIEQIMNCASLLNIVPEKINKVRTWLKSLKQRIGG